MERIADGERVDTEQGSGARVVEYFAADDEDTAGYGLRYDDGFCGYASARNLEPLNPNARRVPVGEEGGC